MLVKKTIFIESCWLQTTPAEVRRYCRFLAPSGRVPPAWADGKGAVPEGLRPVHRPKPGWGPKQTAGSVLGSVQDTRPRAGNPVETPTVHPNRWPPSRGRIEIGRASCRERV